MRLLRKTLHERGPVLDAVVGDALQTDVRRGAQQALLQVLAKAVGDGHRDHEGRYACGYSSDGDTGDDADEGLAALGAQIAGRDEEFEAHEEAFSRQLSAFSQDWIIAIGLEKAAAIGSYVEVRYHCVDSLPIGNVLFTEAPLEFGVLHANHHGAGCYREAGQRPADDQARTHAPGEHLA